MWYVISIYCYWNDIAGIMCSKIIRDKVIPHAISLFSGEAVEQVAEYEDLDDDGDLYDDDDDESDDDYGDDDNHNGDDEDDDNDGDLDDEE